MPESVAGTYSKLFEIEKERLKSPGTPPSAIEPTKASLPVPQKPEPEKQLSQEAKEPKAAGQITEIRLTVPLRSDQVDFLDDLEKKVSRRRSPASRRTQRLTRNSIIRAWLNVLKEMRFDTFDVRDEFDLFERLRATASETSEVEKK